MSNRPKKSKNQDASFAASIDKVVDGLKEQSAALAPIAAASSASSSSAAAAAGSTVDLTVATPTKAATEAASAGSSVKTKGHSGEKRKTMNKALPGLLPSSAAKSPAELAIIRAERMSVLRQKLQDAIASKRNPLWNTRGYVQMRLKERTVAPYFMGCAETVSRAYTTDGLCKKQVQARPVPQVGEMAAGIAEHKDDEDLASTLDTVAVTTEFHHVYTDESGATREHVNAEYVPVYMINGLFVDALDEAATSVRCIGWDDVGTVLFGCSAFELANCDEEERLERFDRAVSETHIFKATLCYKGGSAISPQYLNVTLKALTPAEQAQVE